MSPEKRKELGAFYTPDSLAKQFIETALSEIDRPIHICDIACGSGNLLFAAQEVFKTRFGLNDREAQEYLSGCDINTVAVAAARERLPFAHIEAADGLEWAPPFEPEVVAINPPYTMQYSVAIRQRWGLKGKADLAVAFLLRAAELAPRVSILATNTIAQGASRRCGLARLVTGGWTIFAAQRDVQWPGDAAVTVSIAHLRKGGHV